MVELTIGRVQFSFSFLIELPGFAPLGAHIVWTLTSMMTLSCRRNQRRGQVEAAKTAILPTSCRGAGAVRTVASELLVVLPLGLVAPVHVWCRVSLTSLWRAAVLVNFSVMNRVNFCRNGSTLAGTQKPSSFRARCFLGKVL